MGQREGGRGVEGERENCVRECWKLRPGSSLGHGLLLYECCRILLMVQGKARGGDGGEQVAILCNHQRSVPKGHAGQMEKMEAKLLDLQAELNQLEAELEAAERGKSSRKHADTPSKRSSDPEA